jgi:iron complex outermembrane recepter protein
MAISSQNAGRRSGVYWAVLASAVAPAFISAPAKAEDERGETPQALGTIVVTARKQSELLAKVAAPVSALDGKALLDGGIVTPDQLAERFVGLTVLPNATGNLLFIRGVGGFTLTANSEPAVGWNYDGVFIARPMGTFTSSSEDW